MEASTHVRPSQKLCVCGRSKSMPICDASHDGEGWTCRVEKAWSEMSFFTSFRYQNLGLKLASHYKAGLLLPGEPPMRLRNLCGSCLWTGPIRPRSFSTSRSRIFLASQTRNPG